MQRFSNRRKNEHRSVPGTYYALTLVTRDRVPLLANPCAAAVILEAFNWRESKGHLNWKCLMLMPDHLHAVIQLGGELPLEKLMQHLKSFIAKRVNERLGRRGAFWQPRYFAQGIRDDSALDAIIRYCYQNPVRKGLVSEARLYPYWYCKFQMGY